MKSLALICLFSLAACSFSLAGPRLRASARVGLPASPAAQAPKAVWDYVPPRVVGGVAPKAASLGRKSWELVNPFAPARYGYGKGMVSVNSQGKPKGFILLSYLVW